MALYNICIDRNDTISRKHDVTLDPLTNGKRPRAEIRELLKKGEDVKKSRTTQHRDQLFAMH